MANRKSPSTAFTSIGYNYATVRKWNERFRKSLLKAAAATKPTPPNPLTPEQQEVVRALTLQGYKKGEAVALAKAANGLSSFQERFKSALASRVSPTIVTSESSDEASPERVSDNHAPQLPIECGDLTPSRAPWKSRDR